MQGIPLYFGLFCGAGVPCSFFCFVFFGPFLCRCILSVYSGFPLFLIHFLLIDKEKKKKVMGGMSLIEGLFCRAGSFVFCKLRG